MRQPLERLKLPTGNKAEAKRHGWAGALAKGQRRAREPKRNLHIQPEAETIQDFTKDREINRLAW